MRDEKVVRDLHEPYDALLVNEQVTYPRFMASTHVKILEVFPFHEPTKGPPGFGLRQPSGAFRSGLGAHKSGRRLPQSKTLSRRRAHLRGPWSQCAILKSWKFPMNLPPPALPPSPRLRRTGRAPSPPSAERDGVARGFSDRMREINGVEATRSMAATPPAKCQSLMRAQSFDRLPRRPFPS